MTARGTVHGWIWLNKQAASMKSAEKCGKPSLGRADRRHILGSGGLRPDQGHHELAARVPALNGVTGPRAATGGGRNPRLAHGGTKTRETS